MLANVLFKDSATGETEDTIRVIDFGTSKFLNGNQKLSEKVGSPFYIAPEVLLGKYSEHCDMWSLGCLTFVMIFGYPPFDADDLNSDKIVQQLQKGFDPVVKAGHGAWFPQKIPCSASLRDLLSKMLTLNTVDRISAAEALEHPWVTKQKTLSEKRMSENVMKPVGKFTKTTKLREVLLPMMSKENSHFSEHDMAEMKVEHSFFFFLSFLAFFLLLFFFIFVLCAVCVACVVCFVSV